MAALLKIREAGFMVELAGDKLSINPASALTSNQRDFLKAHRAEIILELQAETSGLSACERQKLLAYLDAIGETDQDIINEYLTECGKDAAILARELQQADDCLQLKIGNTTDFIQCSSCRHLSGDTCQFHDWRVVVDKWRRCNDFDALQKTPDSAVITCKACSHFQSFNTHGGGAGSCSAGVQPFGACWWADTLHDCSQWSAKHD
ncbi:hypothetical protein NP590_08405 [Methylomonas sp. SURF-2]|uniref:TubC N-terminal docking domain-containing protein n=1 Tax=Methylomonas subterranea TaxID=2952225 RepID=A0ABT1TF71_9GAMM|nr:hypothetical protein [Methylomonas sp. SURF-2]MCQ8104122.1 hypothetical protein [Methylomonas sp. SURF-2]